MRYQCALIAVSDLEASKQFYQEVLGQKISLDLGWNVCFEGGFAIQLNFAEIVGVDSASIVERSHNFELYFEVDDFDDFIARLGQFDHIEYVHRPKTHDWQQRVVRIYDPDKHIVEIGEAMIVVARRCLDDGHSAEETARIIQHPIEFVQSVINDNK